MCGLFGIAGLGITTQDMRVFQDLMVLSQVRGIDGTGVAFGNTNTPRCQVFKLANDANAFDWSLKKFEREALYNVMNDYMIGHTRWMTTGKRDSDATQPFNFSNIVGTHNGTLWADYGSWNSDSEMLIASINDNGVGKSVETLYEHDSFALVWVDKKKKTLHMARNDLRTLAFGVHKEREVIYWSSELPLLRAALSRRGIPGDKVAFFNVGTESEIIFKIRDLHDGKGKPRFRSRPLKTTYVKIESTIITGVDVDSISTANVVPFKTGEYDPHDPDMGYGTSADGHEFTYQKYNGGS